MKNKTIFLLLAILLLGTFLRFYNLGNESFWLDEGATALTIKKYSTLEIMRNLVTHGKILPQYYYYAHELPFYYVSLSLWSKVFGINDYSLRAYSAFLGTLTLFLIFYIARFLFNDKVALISAFLASINLTLIWYSQEARQYSYLLFLSVLSAIFLLKSIRHGKTKYIAGLVITNLLIIYSHFGWMVFILMEGIYSLFIISHSYLKKRKTHSKLIIAFFVLLLLYMPIIQRALVTTTDNVVWRGRPNLMQVAEFGIQLSGWLYPSQSLREKLYDFSLNLSLYEFALVFSVILNALFLGILFLTGIPKYFRRKKSTIFLLFMFLFPIVLAFAISTIHPSVSIFIIRQIIYTVVAYIILVSASIVYSKHKNYLVAAIIILNILPLHAYYKNPDKQQFREAVKILNTDEVIFLNIHSAQVVYRYYVGEKDNIIGVKNLEELKSKLNGVNSFWVLLTFTKYSDPKGYIKKYLDENYMLDDRKELFDIELLHYQSK